MDDFFPRGFELFCLHEYSKMTFKSSGSCCSVDCNLVDSANKIFKSLPAKYGSIPISLDRFEIKF